MINLNNKEDRKKLAETIQDDINNYCVELYHDGHRTHLGASIMGEKCYRKLWYIFRWVLDVRHSGRMYRLFNVGKEAEIRFVKYLRGIGCEVEEFDKNGDQFRISGCGGHYGGSLDGKCKLPTKYNINEDVIFVNEFKTNGTGSGYSNVATQGIAKAKEKHFDQMCQYGYKLGLKYGLYLIENKNDSDMTIEIVELDWERGRRLEEKANTIIRSRQPPGKISENSAYADCRYCDFSDICHKGKSVEKNCRSCKFAQPIDNAEWFCNRFNNTIPKDFIKLGCDGHSSVNEW